MKAEYILAILSGVLSFSLKNIGYVFQKKGVNEILIRYKKPRFIHYIKNRIWCFGIGFPFLGGVSLVVGYAFGPISMIMPFTGIGFVFLVLFVKFYLKEKISPVEWVSIGINLAGITLINLKVLDIRETYTDPAEIFGRFLTSTGLIFLILPSIILLCLCFWSAGNRHIYSGTLFAASAGICGGTGLIFQKPFSAGLRLLNNGFPVQTYFVIIFCGLVFIGLSVFAIFLLNTAYTYGRGILVAPIYAIFQMIFPLFGGVLIFNEWRYLDRQGITFQVIGIMLIIIATGILAYYNEKKRS